MENIQKAKILEISSYPPPRAGWGVRIMFVRKYLQEMGHTCQVLNIGQSRMIKSPEYEDVQSGSDYFKKVRWHVKNGYLIHTHLNGDSEKGLILALIAEFYSLFFGKRSVLTFHAGPVQRMFPKEKSKLMAPFYALVFALPQKIICNNEAVKKNIMGYGVPAKKIEAIPAFSVQYLDYEPFTLDDKLLEFIKNHSPVIVSYFFLRPEFFVASMFEGIKALSEKLPGLGLILIGGDTRNDEVIQMVAQAGLSEHVYHAGDVAHDQFMTLLEKADIYLRTPQKDGVCSSVLESLSLKTPVVASENGSRPESVVNFKTDDAVDIQEKLEVTWKNYAFLAENITPPKIRDTVKEEADLLLELER